MSKMSEQAHTNSKELASRDGSAEADHPVFIEQQAANWLTAGLQQASPNKILFKASEELDWLSLPPTCGEQSIGRNNKMSPVFTRLLLYQRAARMNRVLWPKNGRDRRDKRLISRLKYAFLGHFFIRRHHTMKQREPRG